MREQWSLNLGRVNTAKRLVDEITRDMSNLEQPNVLPRMGRGGSRPMQAKFAIGVAKAWLKLLTIRRLLSASSCSFS